MHNLYEHLSRYHYVLLINTKQFDIEINGHKNICLNSLILLITIRIYYYNMIR